jgi:hypothetical protein
VTAGPREDLIAWHGREVIDLVEPRVGADELFKGHHRSYRWAGIRSIGIPWSDSGNSESGAPGEPSLSRTDGRGVRLGLGTGDQ